MIFNQILLTTIFLRKCIDISLENLCEDMGTKRVNSIFPTSIRRPLLSRIPRVQNCSEFGKNDSALCFGIFNGRSRAVIALLMAAIERSGRTYDESPVE